MDLKEVGCKGAECNQLAHEVTYNNEPLSSVTPLLGWAPLLHSRSLCMGVKGGGAPMSTGVGRFRNSWFIDSAP